ncbi:MAG: DnaA/Hda family protein, partial [Patescibacteria group bacterium]
RLLTFDNFAVGPSNKMIFDALRTVALRGAQGPVWFFGDPGVGKSHLLNALKLELEEYGRKVYLVDGATLINKIIEGMFDRQATSPRKICGTTDALLIDGVDCLHGPKTQEELRGIIDSLLKRNGIVVVTSNKNPGELAGMEATLRSRLSSNFMVKIETPDVELRVAILKKRVKKVPDDVLRFLAQIKADPREMIGMLRTILAHHRLGGGKIGLALAERVVLGLGYENSKKPVTAEKIMEAVAMYYKIQATDLKRPERTKKISEPRQVAMVLCRKRLNNLTLKKIGGLFGGKDHTTVLYACDKFDRGDLVTPVVLSAIEAILDS